MKIHVLEVATGSVPTEIILPKPVQFLSATQEFDGEDPPQRHYYAVLSKGSGEALSHRCYLLLGDGDEITEDHLFLAVVGTLVLVEYIGLGDEPPELGG